MTRKQYRFWVNDEKLKEFLDTKSSHENQDFSDFAREIFTLVMENKLDPATINDLQRQKLLADIDYKKVSTEFMRAKLKYTFNFDALPSKAGSHAMKHLVSEENNTAYEPKEEATLQEIIATRWNNYVRELKVLKDGWKIVCSICDTAFLGHINKETAIERFKEHLLESEAETLIKN